MAESPAKLYEAARLEAFLELVPLAAVAISQDGVIRHVNPGLAETFGYAPGELIGQRIEVLLPERFRAGHAHHRNEYFAESRERAMGAGLDLAGRRKDGSEFPVEIGLRAFETPGGMLTVGTVINITERNRAIDEMARISEELRQTNAELEQFVYVASHDLQEPLRMIGTYLQLLERRCGAQLDAEAKEYLAFVVDASSRMKRLIQDLVRFCQTGKAGDIRDVRAEKLVENACFNLAAAIEDSHAEITVGPLPSISADGGLLTQVFQNLIGNAIKFCAPGVKPRIHLSAQHQGQQCVFSVKDNGIGIAPQHSQRVFRIFERLHSEDQYPGSGVGLALAQRIVEGHGGRIWFDSDASGSCFSFSIPAGGKAAGVRGAGAST